MKTDPNTACDSENGSLVWAIIHDGLAHPLMAITGYSSWSLGFHDYTSHKAWPRCSNPSAIVTSAEDAHVLELVRQHYRTAGTPCVIEGAPTPRGYEYRLSALRTPHSAGIGQ
jgi:hypothetical protein